MNFADENLRIKIIPAGFPPISWKAYVEKFDINYELKEKPFEITPLSLPADAVKTRVMQSLDLSFGVYGETEKEIKENYDKLHDLIDSLKPQYTKLLSGYLASDINTFGLIALEFGLTPLIKDKTGKILNKLNLSVNKFSYNIIQDLGVKQANYPVGYKLEKFYSLYMNNPKLLPVGFKINIGAKILLDFESGTKVKSAAATPTGTPAGGTFNLIDATKGFDDARMQIIKNAYAGLFRGARPLDQAFKEDVAKRRRDIVDKLLNKKYINESGETTSLIGTDETINKEYTNLVTELENIQRQ